MSFRVYFQEIIQRRYTIWAVWSLEWVVNSPFGVYSRPNSMDIHHFCRFGCIKCLQLISIYTICSFWEAFDPFTDKNGVNQEGHFQIIHPDHQMAIDSPDRPLELPDIPLCCRTDPLSWSTNADLPLCGLFRIFTFVSLPRPRCVSSWTEKTFWTGQRNMEKIHVSWAVFNRFV